MMVMSFEEKLLQVNDLQNKINGHGKLPDDILKKINYKLRLEWNYTSNSMEGNLLTKSETRSVMIGNITVSGKPIKDVLEVKGHDEVIATILNMGKGALNISEKRIKELHAGIMYEEDLAKRPQIGQWKKEQNYLYNYKNERFDFTAPADVPERMHKLVNWVNAEKEKITREDKNALHPVSLAFRFNLDYVTIHPFYDGNGRTSRILTNLILIAYGYPPVYIKENERRAYYQYLGDIQGYGGPADVFYDYMAGLVIRSQELVLNAIEGKDMEEKDDYIREIDLLKTHIATGEVFSSPALIYNVFEHYSSTLWSILHQIAGQFREFFSEQKFQKTVNRYMEEVDGTRVKDTPVQHIVSNAPKEKKILGYNVYDTGVRSIEWKMTMYGLSGAKAQINYHLYADIQFSDKSYKIIITFHTANVPEEIFMVEQTYGRYISLNEMEPVKALVSKKIMEAIRKDVEEIKNNNE
jgi:Fic family protein